MLWFLRRAVSTLLIAALVLVPVAGALAVQTRPAVVLAAPGDRRLDGFRDILNAGDPVCGRLHPDKNALLYGVRADEVQSSALLALPGVGLVTVGSRDGNRFFPGMGTLFLRMMGEALAAGLRRFG